MNIEAVKRYVFCASFDEFFEFGENGMRQVDFIDYGLGWERLKPGQVGDQYCFEIVDFEVLCPEDQIEFERQCEARQKLIDAEIARSRARHKMRNRMKRIIMGGHYRKYYWLPGFMHGRLILAMLSQSAPKSCTRVLGQLCQIDACTGAYVASLALAYCLRESLRE